MRSRPDIRWCTCHDMGKIEGGEYFTKTYAEKQTDSRYKCMQVQHERSSLRWMQCALNKPPLIIGMSSATPL